MKQVIIIMGMSVIIMLVSLTIMSVESKSDRQDQLNRAVSAAVKQAVGQSQKEDQTSIKSNDDMVAEFLQIMFTSLNSDGDLSVEVMGADCKEGMLDVFVTQKYKYLNGRTGEIKTRKCAIYE